MVRNGCGSEQHPRHERWAGRTGWHLSAERVAKSSNRLDLTALLD